MFAAARHAAVCSAAAVDGVAGAGVATFLLGCRCPGNGFIAGRFHPAGKHAVVAGVLGPCQCDGLARSVDGGLARFSGVGGRFPLVRRLSDDARPGEYGGRSEVSVSRAKAGRCFAGQHFVVVGFHGDGTPGIVVFCAFVAGSPPGTGTTAFDMGVANLPGDGF